MGGGKERKGKNRKEKIRSCHRAISRRRSQQLDVSCCLEASKKTKLHSRSNVLGLGLSYWGLQ